MPSKKLSKTLYQTLLNDIAAIYDGAMKEMGVALEDILTKARWRMGQRIVEVEQEGSLRADYGSRLIEILSSDLTKRNLKGFSARSIWNMRCVYLAFPILQLTAELTWTHYVALSSIKDEKERNAYAQKAIEKGWNVQELKDVLRKENVTLEAMDSQEEKALLIPKKDTNDFKVPRLAFKWGILHTYRIVEPRLPAGRPRKPSSSKDFLWIDCGFFNYHKMKKPQGLELKPGDGVTMFETDDGDYTLKPFDPSSAKDIPLKSVLYTYAAEVMKVADADTITVMADLGFGLFSKQKLRLRKINAPEISTARGKKAREFVVDRLKSSPLVVIKTYSTDIFDRFLVDVFYIPGCDDAQRIAREGILLNQELLDEGLADLWQTVDPQEMAFLN